jgi:hypothetical protein
MNRLMKVPCSSAHVRNNRRTSSSVTKGPPTPTSLYGSQDQAVERFHD